MQPRTLPKFPALAAATLALVTTSHAATPVFFDGFDTANISFNINQDYATRQGGAIAGLTGGVTYQGNYDAVPTQYQQRLTGGPTSQVLLVGSLGGWGPNQSTLISPSYNFTGLIGGEVVGRQISFSMDTFFNNPGVANYYSYTAITVASNAALQVAGFGSGFSVRFEESNFGTATQTIRFYNGATEITVIPFVNPAGTGPMNVDLFINDLVDNNPWDGVGSTTIGVAVNGNPIGSYTKTGGGYTSNVMTFEGSANVVGATVTDAFHTFENLKVYSDVIPEPSAALLGGLGLLGLLRRRR